MRKIIIVILISIVFVLFTACIRDNTEDWENLQELAASEVKEYQWEDLSSILDFRDNSIKGTQHIDVNTYTLRVEGMVENPADLTYNQVLENTACSP